MNIEMLTSRCWNLLKEFWEWSIEKIGSEWIAAVPSFLSMYAPDMYVYFADDRAESEAPVECAEGSNRDEQENDASSRRPGQSQVRKALRIVSSQPGSGGATDNI